MCRALGAVLLAMIAGIAIGCFSIGHSQSDGVDGGLPGGDRARTLEYWGKVRSVMQKKSTSSDLRELAAVIRRQAETVRELPIDGVDPDLIVAANAVAQSQEKMLAAADAAGFNAAFLKTDNDMRNAGQQTSAAIGRLKALGPTLTARYHVPFQSLDE